MNVWDKYFKKLALIAGLVVAGIATSCSAVSTQSLDIPPSDSKDLTAKDFSVVRLNPDGPGEISAGAVSLRVESSVGGCSVSIE